MFGLSFLSPLYLLGALAVAVPVLIHLFRRRTEVVVDFPAVRFIAPSTVEQKRRRRLRELVLLALRVSALVLLASAFARPYLAGPALSDDVPVTVVAVDTSFSLSAPGTFDRVREVASTAIEQAPAGNAVALVSFGDEAVTVSPPTTDRAGLVAAVQGLTAGASGTRYTAALSRAAEIVGARAGRIALVTDLQQAGWDAATSGGIPEDLEVTVLPVNSPLANVAVTSAERRGRGIVAGVHNFGFTTRDVEATLTVDETEIERASVQVAGRSAATVEFARDIPPTGAARVTIDDADGYAADNTRYLVLDPPRPTTVTVVVADPSMLRGGLYVERALAAAGGARTFGVTVVDGRTFSSTSAADLARQDAVVVLGTRTLDRNGRDRLSGYLSGGSPLLLSLGPDVDPGTLGDVLGVDLGVAPDIETAPDGRSTLVVGDGRHPVFRPFSHPASALGDVAIQRYRRLSERDGRTVLARFSGGAIALAEERVGEGRLLVFTSDLDNQWNRFPLSPAFVPFIVEALGYLTAGVHSATAWALPSRPAGLEPEPGVFTVAEGGDAGSTSGPDQRVALNVDVRESNPASMSPEAFTAAVPRVARAAVSNAAATARAAEDEQRLWQLGLLVMLAALAGEGLIGRRAS